MAQVSFLKGIKSQLESTEIKEGQILFTTDEQALYLDLAGSKRIRISDIIIVESVEEQETPIDTAIYYETSTKALKIHSGEEWNQINNDTGAIEVETTGTGKDDELIKAEYDGASRKITITIGKKIVDESTLNTKIGNIGQSADVATFVTDKIGEITKEENTLKDQVQKHEEKLTGIDGTVNEAIEQAKNDVIGSAEEDTKDSKTIEGAKKYTDDKIASAISSTYKAAGSIAQSELISDLLKKDNEGKVYNLTDALVVNEENAEDYVEGTEQTTYPIGTNVVIIDVGSGSYKFDILAGFVDLSDYVKTNEMSQAISQAKTDLIGSASEKEVTSSTIKAGVEEAEKYTDAALTWGDFTAGV